MSGSPTSMPIELRPIEQDRPKIECLPAAVAARILDMWRAGAVFTQFPDHLQARDHLRSALNDVVNFARPFIWAVRPGTGSNEMVDKFSAMHSAALNWYDQPEQPHYKLNNWVGATKLDFYRLACETSMAFFHAALEVLDENDRKTISDAEPLIRCLRMTRNLVLHVRMGAATRKDCTLISDHTQRDGSQLKILVPATWHLEITATDLGQTRDGRNCPELVEWFPKVCSRYPFWYILQVATEYLCRYFEGKSQGKA